VVATELPKTITVEPSQVSAVVLAAGLSSRMGEQNKLDLIVSGKPLVQHAIDAVVQAGIERVVVVLGHQKERLEASVNLQGLTVVFNEYYEQGQSSSVMCGLGALGTEQAATMICLGDQPMIQSSHIRRLVTAFNECGDKQVVVPYVNAQRGNPVVISEQVRQQVLANTQNPGCRRFIDSNPQQVYQLELSDPAFITDLDTADDVHRYQQRSDLFR